MTTTWTCDCSEDDGPCEQHCEVLVIREGASLHTGDELVMLKIGDLVDNGYADLAPWGVEERKRLDDALEAAYDPHSGTAHFEDANDSDAASSLLQQVETDTGGDVWVISNDGYTIVRPTPDCPLLTL